MQTTEQFFNDNNSELVRSINEGIETLTKGVLGGVAVAVLDDQPIIMNNNNDLYIKVGNISLKTLARVIVSPCWVIMRVTSKTYPATLEQPEDICIDETEVSRSIHPLTTANDYLKTLFSMYSDQMFDAKAMEFVDSNGE